METTTSTRKPIPGFWRILIYGALSTALLMVLYVVNLQLETHGWALDNENIWYAVRSSGVVAYFLLTTATAWGIALSSKAIKQWMAPALALELHTYLAWTAIGMTVYHAYLLLFSNFFDYDPIDLLVPFIGPYEPVAVGLGIVGIYVMVLTSTSFYLIPRIGYQRFRQLHYLTYLAFGLATLHGWLAGTDGAWLHPIYLVASISVVGLTLWRSWPTTRRTVRRASN